MKSLKTRPSVFERRKKVEMTVSVQSSLNVTKKANVASNFSTYIRKWMIKKRYIKTVELRSVDIRYSISKTCITIFIGFYHPIDIEKIDHNAEIIRDSLVFALSLFRDVFTFDDSLSEREKLCKFVNYDLLASVLNTKSKILKSVGI